MKANQGDVRAHQWIFDIRSRRFFLLVVLFVFVTLLVYAKVTAPIDNGIETRAQSAGGNFYLDYAMQIFSEIGSVFYMMIFCLILLILKKTRRLGLVLILAVLAGTIASGYLKLTLDRERPTLPFLGAPFPIKPEPDTSVFGIGSYPSGHATRAAAFAFVLGFALSGRFPRGCYLLWIFPAVVSTSRVFILEHFPMDVIGGTILGIIIADVVSKKLKLHLIFENQKPS